MTPRIAMTRIADHAIICIIEHINTATLSANSVGQTHPDDLPNEFWIVLSGEVGIFTPRLEDEVVVETKTFEKIRQALGYPAGVPIEGMDSDTIYMAADFSKLDSQDRDLLSHIRRIENNVMKFKHSYLNARLGDLPDSVLDSQEMFNHVVSVSKEGRSAQVQESERKK